MVYLLGTCPVTVWEDCQVASSSLMNPMHNAVQEEVVGPSNHLHAICPLHFNVRSHSWYCIFNCTYVYTYMTSCTPECQLLSGSFRSIRPVMKNIATQSFSSPLFNSSDVHHGSGEEC